MVRANASWIREVANVDLEGGLADGSHSLLCSHRCMTMVALVYLLAFKDDSWGTAFVGSPLLVNNGAGQCFW
jgi:hypothetical protein